MFRAAPQGLTKASFVSRASARLKLGPPKTPMFCYAKVQFCYPSYSAFV